GCGAAALASGIAACITNGLGAGGHAITAVYSGDGTYLPSTSAAAGHAVNAGPQLLAASPASLDFGGQSINTQTAELTTVMTNTSAGAVTVSSVVAPASFRVVSHDCATLAPAASCTIAVAAVPVAQGAVGGLLAVSYA